MRLVLVLILIPFLSIAQHKSVSYELMNEIGTYKLISLTFSHELDNSEGITYVIHKQDGDTVYQLEEFLNGWVALSNNGQTIAHLVSEKDKEPLDHSLLSMYRNGKKFDTAQLERLVHYELISAKSRDRLPTSGWLRNDSIYHQMATHPFYITEDRLYLSFDKPTLAVFDLNQLFHIYTGDGANHFHQNYYSLPNAPYRVEYSSEEYFPQSFPQTKSGGSLIDAVSALLKIEKTIPNEAKFRMEIEFKLDVSGHTEWRNTTIYDLATNAMNEEKSNELKSILENLQFQTSTIPPKHPAWIFSKIVWLK